MRRLFLVFTAFTLGIFGGVITTPTVAHASPPTCTSTPTTWSTLQSEMLGTGDAIQPRVVCLGADLTGGTNEKLRLAHTQYVVLDLNGHSLVITGGTAGAGIDTNVDGHLTIQDSNQGSNSLTVTGGPNSAGIGGTSGSGGFITISSGNVYAEGGSNGTGIGGGNGGAGGTITFDGGIIAAIGGTGAAGIGGGYYGSGGNISIRSGNISPTGGFGAAGIGSGYNDSNGPSGIDGGIITIDGGDLTATGGDGGAGIGGGYFCKGGTITISGGAITAIGGDGGAGIGSGGGSLGNGGSVSISGGAVNGRGGQWGAGIGGGDSGNGGNISVTNGSVVATGGLDAAGIGGGNGGNGGNVTLSGGLIQSIRWVNTSAVIGSGRSGSLGGTLTVTTVNSTSWTNVNTAGSAGISPATSSTTTSNAAAAISVSRTEGYDYVTFAFKYAVSFDTGGGSSVAQQEVGYGQRPSQPTAPSRPGYAMDTWHTGSASGPTYNFTTGATITAATTLYASWGMLDTTCTSANKPTTWAAIAGSFSSATSSNSSSGNPKVICLGADISTTGTHLTIASGAYVTLDLNGYSLSISAVDDYHAGIEITGAHLTVQDSHATSNSLTVVGGALGAGIGGGNGSPGGTFTITAGNVDVTGGDFGAGIGGGQNGAGGTTTINGGIINVTAGYSGAGIGGGDGADGGTTTINDGLITVISNSYGAGIGGGEGHSLFANRGNGGVTTINGGVTTAVGGSYAAGIGGGDKGRGGITIINNGIVSATAGTYGAGIGGGDKGRGEYITINGGVVNALGGGYGAGIGDGSMPSAGLISLAINGGVVTARGGDYAAGIGTGFAAPTCGDIAISAGVVTATGGIQGAGIGGGYLGTGCTVALSGGRIQARAIPAIFSGLPYAGAPIGSGYSPSSSSAAGTLTLLTSTSSTFSPVPNGSGTNGGIAPATTSSIATNGAPARSVTQTNSDGYLTFTFNYAVSFNSGGGSNVSQQEVGYGSRPARPTDPTLAGQSLSTWHTTSASGPSYDFSTGATITAATTLYASWNAITAAPLSINPGTRAVTITQTDRQVGSAWNVSVHSAPVTLGSGVTDGSAALIFSGTIPAVTAGVHHVEVSSTASNSVAAVQKLWFVCDQTGAIIGVYATEAEANAAWAALQPSAASLSSTGLTASAIIKPLTAGALLLLLGLALVAWRRRRTY